MQTSTACNLRIKIEIDGIVTLVMPIAPIFPEYVVKLVPPPSNPPMKQPTPSVKIPRLTACEGGGGAYKSLKNKLLKFTCTTRAQT